MDIISWDFVSLAVLVFAVFMILLGIFTAYFGKGKSRAYGLIMLVFGLIVGIGFGYLLMDGPIEVLKNVEGWTIVYNAIVNVIAVAVGALIAVGVFLVAVLKS